MPYRTHSALNVPIDSAVPIWRYFDVSRLLTVLQDKALWFARADQLGDPWEGSISAATFELHGDSVPRIAKAWQLKTAVNCWHMNEHESAAMWDRYGRSHVGVAIRSTVQRLIDSLQSSPQDVFLAAVSYIDYDRTPIPLENALYPLVHKRASYSFERELRALTMFPSSQDGTYDLRNNPTGVLVPIDIMRLIEAIYVAPFAPDWFVRMVSRAVVTTLGAELPLRQSRLGEQPLF